MSDKQLYVLTSIDRRGKVCRDIIGSNYVITIQPVYNSLLGEPSGLTLLYGEHLEPLTGSLSSDT